jgi:hypothetical protein
MANIKVIANNAEWNPFSKPVMVAKETTMAVWPEGMPE